MTRIDLPPCHPAADLYPMMDEEALRGLSESIKRKGQQHPIIMIGDLILDGRNRWLACKMAGVEPKTKQWSGKGEPLEVVEALNDNRRHYQPGQLAAIAAAKMAYHAAKAKERQAAGGGDKRSKKGGPVSNESSLTGRGKKAQDNSQRSVAQAAKEVGAGVAATAAAASMIKKAPTLVPLLRDGKITIEEAKRLAKLSPGERERAVDAILSGEKPEAIAPKPKAKGSRPSLGLDAAAALAIADKPMTPAEVSVDAGAEILDSDVREAMPIIGPPGATQRMVASVTAPGFDWDAFSERVGAQLKAWREECPGMFREGLVNLYSVESQGLLS